MTPSSVTLDLDPEAAKAYGACSSQDREKLRLLFALCLKEVSADSAPLAMLMDRISDQAVQRGLTPRKLKALLHEP